MGGRDRAATRVRHRNLNAFAAGTLWRIPNSVPLEADSFPPGPGCNEWRTLGLSGLGRQSGRVWTGFLRSNGSAIPPTELEPPLSRRPDQALIGREAKAPPTVV